MDLIFTQIAKASLLLPGLISTAYTISVHKENMRFENKNSTAANSLIVTGLRLPNVYGFESIAGVDVELPLSGITCLRGPAAVGKTALAIDGIYSIIRRGLGSDFDGLSTADAVSGSNLEFERVNALVPAVLLSSALLSFDAKENLLTFLGLCRQLAQLCADSALPLTGDGKKWRRAGPQQVIAKLISSQPARPVAEAITLAEKKSFMVGAFFHRNSFLAATDSLETLKSFFQSYLQAGFRRFMVGSTLVKLSDYSSLPDSDSLQGLLGGLSNEPLLTGVSVLVDSLTPSSLAQARLEQSIESAFDLSGTVAAVMEFNGDQLRHVDFISGAYFASDLSDVRPLVSEETFLKLIESGESAGTEYRLSDFLLAEETLDKLLQLSLAELTEFLERHFSATPEILLGFREQLNSFRKLGIDYLSCSQSLSSLSSGELRKVVLAFYLSAQLTDTLYILDHAEKHFPASELDLLSSVLADFCRQGNGVLTTETDPFFSAKADNILELRIENGKAALLDSRKEALVTPADRSKLPLGKKKKSAKQTFAVAVSWPWNAAVEEFAIVERGLFAVLGGIGSGKTTLLRTIADQVEAQDRAVSRLAPPLFFEHVDENAAAALSVVETFGLEKALAEIFVAQASARRSGLSAEHFLLNKVAGGCDECGGSGRIAVADLGSGALREDCQRCGGSGFAAEVLAVVYNGVNIFQALNMHLEEAADVFETQQKLVRVLELLNSLGLQRLRLKDKLMELAFSERVKLRVVLLHRLLEEGPRFAFVEGLFCGLSGLELQHCGALVRSAAEAGSTLVYSTYNEMEAEMADDILRLPGRDLAD